MTERQGQNELILPCQLHRSLEYKNSDIHCLVHSAKVIFNLSHFNLNVHVFLIVVWYSINVFSFRGCCILCFCKIKVFSIFCSCNEFKAAAKEEII